MNNVIDRKDMPFSMRGNKKFKGLKEIITFIFVGGSTTMLEVSTMNLLWWTTGIYKGNINYLFKFITFVICSTFGYFMNKRLTFKAKSSLKDYFKYSSFFAFLSIIEAIIIAKFTKYPVHFVPIEVWANIVTISASSLTGILNFFVAKFLIFKKSN